MFIQTVILIILFLHCLLNYLFYMQFPVEYGLILTLVKFVSLEAVLLTRVWWRCTVVDSGELCVTTGSAKLMLIQFADSWGTTAHSALTTYQSKFTHQYSICIIYANNVPNNY